jgi:hypothetical protein
MSRCIMTIPRPRRVGLPVGVRHRPWSTISMKTACGSAQHLMSTVSPTVAGR